MSEVDGCSEVVGWLSAQTYGNASLPKAVLAGVTTRIGGVSEQAFSSLNMATHVGDEPARVADNRARLRQHLGECDIQWLDQIHSNKVIYSEHKSITTAPSADGMWTDQRNVALAIMTADCVPVLLWSNEGDCIGAAHAGWRGLRDGVLSALVQQMPVAADQLHAWIGPCIGVNHYEVGAEVWQPLERMAGVAGGEGASLPACIRQHDLVPDKRMVDLAGIAFNCLQQVGLQRVSRSSLCCYEDRRFYSYRRSHQQSGDPITGRMASVIMLR